MQTYRLQTGLGLADNLSANLHSYKAEIKISLLVW